MNITGFGDVLETASISAAGNVTRQRTDGAGRTLQSVDAEDYVTNITYDASGNQLTVRDGNNVGQDCTYDALGRRIQCADTQELTESVSRSWEYDLAGNVITETDAKGKDTVHVYDARGRKTSTTDRLAGVTAWAYDAAGNLLSLTDAENQTTSYDYDAAGRKVKETYPDHVTGSSVGSLDYGIVEFSYDPAGRLSVKTDQQGDTCTYNYDLGGRLTSRDYVGHASGPLAGQSDSDTFTYDAAARMLTATSGRYSNTVTFSYDDVGRRATESLTIYGQTYTVGTDYDEEGQVSQLTYPDGSLVQRAYTPRGQLQQITYDSQVIDTRQYDAGGRMTQRTLGNGLVETRTYRSDNLTATINTPGVTSFSYTYDANKNKTAETIGGVMQPYGYTATYDDEDRLATWTRDDSNLTQSWNLSPVGDWTSFTEDGVVDARTHDPTHELTAIDTTSLTYDAKGNLTTNSSGQSYTWYFDNKMVSATVPAGCSDGIEGTHGYGYDALGRRVSKSVAGGTAMVFVSITQPLKLSPKAGQVVSEYAPGTTASSPSRSFAYGTYVDEPVLLVDTPSASEEFYYYHASNLHSVVAITDTLGGLGERYAYTAYGSAVRCDAAGVPIGSAASTVGNQYTFTGRRYDDETGLYYYRNRYYAAELGRFASRDPIGYVDGGNLYAGYFVPGGVDPNGLFVAPFPGGDWCGRPSPSQPPFTCGCGTGMPGIELDQLFYWPDVDTNDMGAWMQVDVSHRNLCTGMVGEIKIDVTFRWVGYQRNLAGNPNYYVRIDGRFMTIKEGNDTGEVTPVDPSEDWPWTPPLNQIEVSLWYAWTTSYTKTLEACPKKGGGSIDIEVGVSTTKWGPSDHIMREFATVKWSYGCKGLWFCCRTKNPFTCNVQETTVPTPK